MPPEITAAFPQVLMLPPPLQRRVPWLTDGVLATRGDTDGTSLWIVVGRYQGHWFSVEGAELNDCVTDLWRLRHKWAESFWA